MTTDKTPATLDAVRNLIVCDTQFGWSGETTLKLPELLDLQERGWMIEGDDNNEFELTSAGRGVVARALESGAPDTGIPTSPSPGGQEDGLVESLVQVMNAQYDGLGYLPADVLGALNMAVEALAARQPVGEQHPDDLAVDAFAAAMKAKMAKARAKGRGGWEDPAQCSADDLSRMLREHVEKGDPRDVANFCMMLQQRGEAIAAHQPVGQEPVLYQMWNPVSRWDECTKEEHEDWQRRGGGKTSRALYASPPAQAVDLRQFRKAALAYWSKCQQAVTGSVAGPRHSQAKLEREDANRLLALIDSKAVGNG